MRNLPTIQDRLKPISPIFHTGRRSYIDSTICTLQYGLNNRLTSGGRKRLNLSHGRPRPFEGGNSLSNHQNSHDGWNRQPFTQKLVQTIWITYKMLSDQGPQFAAKAFRAMLSRLGVNMVLSMAYHPQTDGTTECINQEIEAYLAIYCHSHPET
jgi:hypothetical protein